MKHGLHCPLPALPQRVSCRLPGHVLRSPLRGVCNVQARPPANRWHRFLLEMYGVVNGHACLP